MKWVSVLSLSLSWKFFSKSWAGKLKRSSIKADRSGNGSHNKRRFNSFCTEYNEYRPHEALGMRTPAECYRSSPRQFPGRLAEISYPDHMQVRRVRNHGDIKYFGRRLFTTQSLAGQYIGIEQEDEDLSLLWYCGYLLGQLDHKTWRIGPPKSRRLSPQLAAGINAPKPRKVLPMSSV